MKKKILQFIITLIILGVGVAIFLFLKNQKQAVKTQKRPLVFPKARAVETVMADHVAKVRGYGTVTPLREVQVAPQVSGKVIYVSPNLLNGGSIQKEEVLIKIDPADYELTVTSLRARVADSESFLQMTEEESQAAVEEWRRVHGKGKQPPALVAKEPQLAAAKAKLKADSAELQKAELQVQRCGIKAPFDGRVSQKNVDIGQYATLGQVLASIFSVEAAEISVALHSDSLRWLYVPGFTSRKTASKALIKAKVAGISKTWTGKIVRAEGKIDPQTRMIKVVARVNNPYQTIPPLAAGLFVEVELKGRKIKNSVQIPRSALRDQNIVWVIDDEDRLTFRRVETALASENDIIVQKGLAAGEHVVTSEFKVVSNGMKVQKIISAEK